MKHNPQIQVAKLHANACLFWNEATKLRDKAEQLQIEGNKLLLESYQLWASDLWTESIKLRDKAGKLHAEGDQLHDKGDLLHAKGDQLLDEACQLWNEAYAAKLAAETGKLEIGQKERP